MYIIMQYMYNIAWLAHLSFDTSHGDAKNDKYGQKLDTGYVTICTVL